MMAVGAMIASMVSVTTPLAFGSGDEPLAIQGVLDQIMPCLLPAINSRDLLGYGKEAKYCGRPCLDSRLFDCMLCGWNSLELTSLLGRMIAIRLSFDSSTAPALTPMRRGFVSIFIQSEYRLSIVGQLSVGL